MVVHLSACTESDARWCPETPLSTQIQKFKFSIIRSMGIILRLELLNEATCKCLAAAFRESGDRSFLLVTSQFQQKLQTTFSSQQHWIARRLSFFNIIQVLVGKAYQVINLVPLSLSGFTSVAPAQSIFSVEIGTQAATAKSHLLVS